MKDRKLIQKNCFKDLSESDALPKSFTSACVVYATSTRDDKMAYSKVVAPK